MEGLDGIEQLMLIRYQASQSAMKGILAQEVRLRENIERLDQQMAEANLGDPAMKSVGADVLWRSWAGKMKSQLNVQLAQVLAQKEKYMGQVRKEYGKFLVSQQLNADHRQLTDSLNRKKRLQTAIDDSVIGSLDTLRDQ